MKKLIILFFVYWLVFSCNNDGRNKERINKCNQPLVPYKVIYRDSITARDSLNYNLGVILLKNVPQDSLYRYCSYFQSLIETCKRENLSYVEFYRNDSTSNDSIAQLGKKTGLYGNFFIAKVDALKYGAEWKKKIDTRDIDYYNFKKLPIIRPRLPVIE